jgi:putative hemolysin
LEGDSSPAGPIPLQILFITLQSLVNAPTTTVWIALLIILVLISCSAIMSASEIAFFSLSNVEVDELRESEDDADNRVAKLLSNARYLLSSILITNNLVNIGVVITFYFVTKAVFNFIDIDLHFFILRGYTIEFLFNVVIVTFFLVLFGEATPKIYAAHNKVKLARTMAPFFIGLVRIMKPINYLLVGSTQIIERRLKKHNAEIDIEEINKAIEITVEEKGSTHDASLLKSIVHFGNIMVKQIMRPRNEVSAVNDDWDFKQLIDYVKEVGYSRLPVYKETLDNITGVLHIKDLLEHINQGPDFGWQSLVRKPLFVPENKKIDDLLREIQENRNHLAIVVDEYGGTSGIVTLEDIVEEVVGDIKDEFDDANENTGFKKLDDNNFIFEGKTTLMDVCKLMVIEQSTFDDVKGEAETLGGLLLELAGRLPKGGEEYKYLDFTFRILSIQNNRIEKVKITVL